MGDELRACPFCGGDPVLIHPHNGSAPYVLCNSCKAAGPQSEAAVVGWQMRAPTRPGERDAEGYQVVGYAPKGHLARYLKGQNTGCWIYGSPTAEDNDKVFSALPTSAQDSAEGVS